MTIESIEKEKNSKIKLLLGAIVQFIIRMIVTIIKKKAYTEAEVQIKKESSKRQEVINEKAKIIGKKYDDLRDTPDTNWVD